MGKDTDEIIQKLITALNKAKEEEVHTFTQEEVKDIEYLLVVVNRLRVLGWFGKYIIAALVMVGLVILNVERIMKFFGL